MRRATWKTLLQFDVERSDEIDEIIEAMPSGKGAAKRKMEQLERRAFGPTDGVTLADIILPSQYFDAIGSGGLCCEQRLMLAVLVDAINSLQRWHRLGSARKRRAVAEAAQWVNTSGTGYPFSFDSICDALGIDPPILRDRLSALTMGPGSSQPGLGRLRLRESSRAQHITANRVRWRQRHLWT